MLPLVGIAIVVLGFAFRVNPLLVVASAAIATGLGAGHSLTDVVGEFGKAFINSRSVAVVWLALPVIAYGSKGLSRPGQREYSDGTLVELPLQALVALGFVVDLERLFLGLSTSDP